MSKHMYYFSASDKRLRYGDGREVIEGITHTVEGPPVLCEHGLHASTRIIDALSYMPGPYLWIVELGGEVVHGDDKAVATERTYFRGADMTEVLREFARRQALINIELIRPYTDKSDLIYDWLTTGNENMRDAAADAARAAADAVYAAARAARAAAYAAAARAAVYAAVYAAARAAVYAAADAADAASADADFYAAANEMLTEMVNAALTL
jgi:hypothetical protein